MTRQLRSLWLLFAQSATVALAVAAVALLFWKPPAHSYSGMLADVLPSVVSIHGRAEGDSAEASTLGAGVIINDDGHILTNYHLIANAKQLRVRLDDDSRHWADVAGVDPEIDIAVLKINTAGNLKAIPVAEDPAPGDIVFAIGHPYGLDGSASMGIVSAVNRDHLRLTDYRGEKLIQTDAAINPGNSGGPLTNTNGELVGINAALYSRPSGLKPQGIGFAVPAKLVRHSYLSLTTGERHPEDTIGAQVRPLSSTLRERINRAASANRRPARDTASADNEEPAATVLIAKIWRGSLAEQRGLKTGDIITGLDTASLIFARENLRLPPETKTLRILRNNKEQIINLR